jgi:hypothetical protein
LGAVVSTVGLPYWAVHIQAKQLLGGDCVPRKGIIKWHIHQQ